jgi:hypothetical protein
MRKARAFFLILALGLGFIFGPGLPFLQAQEQEEQENEEEPGYDEGEIPVEPDWDGYMPDLYSKGDQTITISLGTIFPTVFFNTGTPVEHNFSPPVGGALSLAYTHFLGAHLYLGGEISFNFNNTLAKNTVYLVPIGLRAGYQFVLRRFEFPLTLTVGFAPQRYLNLGYFGFFMKGGASAFYRFNPEWSFGLNVDWGWYPQWPLQNKEPDPEKNMDANIIGLTISARYHF